LLHKCGPTRFGPEINAYLTKGIDEFTELAGAVSSATTIPSTSTPATAL